MVRRYEIQFDFPEELKEEAEAKEDIMFSLVFSHPRANHYRQVFGCLPPLFADNLVDSVNKGHSLVILVPKEE